MISTSSYENYNSDKYTTYSISGNRGIGADYKGECFPALAPKKEFWKKWHDNILVIPKEENDKFYIEEYYKQVLSKLDPEEILKKLDNSILLCYENPTQFCHRHIVAAWLELFLDVEVPEIIVNEYNIKYVSKPAYIKDYLEEIIRKNINMKGFNSLRALYLFEKGEKLEEKANELEKNSKGNFDNLRQEACYLRCDADQKEEEYNLKLKRHQ